MKDYSGFRVMPVRPGCGTGARLQDVPGATFANTESQELSLGIWPAPVVSRVFANQAGSVMGVITDPVGDYLARIRNAQMAGHRYTDIPASKIKRAITQILKDKGYISTFLNVDDGRQGLLRVYLKYDRHGKGAIVNMKRISKPGLRVYTRASDLPRVQNGLGIAIVSTSRGVMSDKEARKVHIGGEVLAHIF